MLTTNLDGLVEHAFAGSWLALARATGDIAQRRGYILKLHGTLLERATWVLTRTQHNRALYADPLLRGACSALFHTCPIRFVGYGLSDDDLDGVLGRVRTLARGGEPAAALRAGVGKHGDPVPAIPAGAEGIRLIAYDNPDGKHGAVTAAQRDLAARP